MVRRVQAPTAAMGEKKNTKKLPYEKPTVIKVPVRPNEVNLGINNSTPPPKQDASGCRCPSCLLLQFADA